MINLSQIAGAEQPLRLLCLGAHCDDIEIGCGGSILRLLRERPCHVDWVVFASTPQRKIEAQNAARAFLKNAASSTITIHDFRDSFFPYRGEQIKEKFEELKALKTPHIIFTHQASDAHQDHRLMRELTWNTFRNHLILEYEIPKYDGDMGRPNFFIQFDREICNEKAKLIYDSFVTQQGKAWFTEDTFHALARLRGMECNSPGNFAEGFYAPKVVF